MSLAPFLLPLLTKKLIDRKAAKQEFEDHKASVERRKADLQDAKADYDRAVDELLEAEKTSRETLTDEEKKSLGIGLDLVGKAFNQMFPLPDISKQTNETALDGLQRIIDAYAQEHYDELKTAISKDLAENPDMHASLDNVKEMYNVESDDELPVLYPLVPSVFKDDLNKLGVAMPSGGGL